MGYGPVLYHGGDTTAAYVGMCLTDDFTVASQYAHDKNASDQVLEVSIAWAGLVVADGPAAYIDNDGDLIAPGDDGPVTGCDILVYVDDGIRGGRHTTWRLMSVAAVDATTVTNTLTSDYAQAEQ